MEVHHHAHTEPKKFTHYLWEFLMLFLAVFAGFLAENQREHIVEHQREKQYIITLLEDLKSDTVLLPEAVKYWDTINHSIDSVADAIQLPPSKTDWIKAYSYINKAFDYYTFRYNDRTIAQLKNAGGFRLIRNKKVANLIIAYDQLNNDAIINIRNQHHDFFESAIALRNKVFVQEIINDLFDRYSYDPPPFSSYRRIDIMLNKNKNPFFSATQPAYMFEFKNALLGYRKDFSNMNWGYRNLKNYMNDLIKAIEDNYDLK